MNSYLNKLAMENHAAEKLTQKGVMFVFGLPFGIAAMLFLLGCILRAIDFGV